PNGLAWSKSVPAGTISVPAESALGRGCVKTTWARPRAPSASKISQEHHREQFFPAGQTSRNVLHRKWFAPMRDVVLAKEGDALVIGCEPSEQPHHLQIAMGTRAPAGCSTASDQDNRRGKSLR